MIIFNLDGTLADCEHRRHFIDPKKRDDCYEKINPGYMRISEGWFYKDRFKMSEPPLPMKFIPDWKAFFEACDQDKPIYQTINILKTLWVKEGEEIQIWSGRCQSVKNKTLDWIKRYIFGSIEPCVLRMRAIGDNTPDEVLKETWLDEAIFDGKKIEMVFDDRPKVVKMWKRRGIFVFNCLQKEGEF